MQRIELGCLQRLTDKLLSGVVTQSKETLISVALPDTVDLALHNGSIPLVKLANDVTTNKSNGVFVPQFKYIYHAAE